MSTPLATSLPYGMRDVKLTRYSDAGGTVLGSTSIDLPNMQTFSFSETEEFQELRGDDRVVTVRGRGSQVEWELEAGGISFPAWSILTGGQIIESGLTPNRKVILRKFSTASRPYFRAEGQAISDSGGDLHAIVYRCRANDTVEGEFADGEFFVTSASGAGLALLDTDWDLLYDFVQNETAVSIPTTPVPNPQAPPKNLEAAAATGTSPTASSILTWEAVTGATTYNIERKLGAAAFAAGTPATATAPAVTSTQTALSTGTWTFRVNAVTPQGTTEWSNEDTVVVS